MDDRELEARLQTHLHRRFDNANPSPELTAGVQQALRTEPAGVLPNLRLRAPLRSWSLVGVMGMATLLAVAAIRFGSVIAPGDPGQSVATPTIVPSAPDVRWFVAVPPTGSQPTKTETGLASDVLNARLRAFDFGADSNGFTSASGHAITFALPMTGPSDASIFGVLVAPGDVEFVPLPDSYTDGTHTALAGQPLPTDEAALFGWDGVESASMDVDQQDRPVLTIRLRPAAAEAFGDYTSANVGSSFAIVIDGDVALAPVVNEPISGGAVQVSGGGLAGSDEAEAFDLASAILIGGKLPDAWVPTGVPEILQPDELADRIARELNGATLEAAQLDAIAQGIRWTPVWRVRLGNLAHSCPMLPADGSRTCPPTEGTVTYTFDAETGEFLSAEPAET